MSIVHLACHTTHLSLRWCFWLGLGWRGRITLGDTADLRQTVRAGFGSAFWAHDRCNFFELFATGLDVVDLEDCGEHLSHC